MGEDGSNASAPFCPFQEKGGKGGKGGRYWEGICGIRLQSQERKLEESSMKNQVCKTLQDLRSLQDVLREVLCFSASQCFSSFLYITIYYNLLLRLLLHVYTFVYICYIYDYDFLRSIDGIFLSPLVHLTTLRSWMSEWRTLPSSFLTGKSNFAINVYLGP